MNTIYQSFRHLASMTCNDLYDHLEQWAVEHGYNVITDGKRQWIDCQPPTPHAIAVVAHLDLVGGNPPPADRIVNLGGLVRVSGGGILGADDRAGVTVIYELVNAGFRPHLYFTTGEETGGIGAKKLAVDQETPETTRLLLEFDRQGSHEVATYSNNNPAVAAYFAPLGYDECRGSYTDIETLQAAWNVAGANMSVGYYGQHGQSERLLLPELERTIANAAYILDNPPETRLDYIARVTPSYQRTGSLGGYYGDNVNQSFVGSFATPCGLPGGKALDPACNRMRFWNYHTEKFQDTDPYTRGVADGPGGKTVWFIVGSDNKPVYLDKYPQPPKPPKIGPPALKGKKEKHRKATKADKEVLEIEGTMFNSQSGGRDTLIMKEQKYIIASLTHPHSDPLRLGAIIYLPLSKRFLTVTRILRKFPKDETPTTNSKPSKPKDDPRFPECWECWECGKPTKASELDNHGSCPDCYLSRMYH
jgi:hypothetical protein